MPIATGRSCTALYRIILVATKKRINNARNKTLFVGQVRFELTTMNLITLSPFELLSATARQRRGLFAPPGCIIEEKYGKRYVWEGI